MVRDGLMELHGIDLTGKVQLRLQQRRILSEATTTVVNKMIRFAGAESSHPSGS